MDTIIAQVLPGIILLLLPLLARTQNFDKKLFCKDLSIIAKAFAQSPDSLKAGYVGENILGIRQWKTKYALTGAISRFYEHAFLETSEEYRATYIMSEHVGQRQAEELYRQIVAAVRWCYGTEYSLSEQVTSEWDNSGKKHQHHDATFTFTGTADKQTIMPVIQVRSFAIESSLYSVTVELYSIQ